MQRLKFYFCEMHPQVALVGKTPMLILNQQPSVELAQPGRMVRARETHCYRCGQPIDWAIPYRDQHTGEVNAEAGTVEHVQPLSKRPDLAEDPANLAASHRRCNLAAGATNQTPSMGLRSQRW